MYKIRDTYYIWVTRSGDTQCMLKSTVGPFGPYEARDIVTQMRSPIPGSGPPHQGAIVDTPAGHWYYISFTDAFPAGRVPLLAPLVFDTEGWPHVGTDYPDEKGQWLLEYRNVHDLLSHQVKRPKACFRRYDFSASQLEHCWEWNHNPDNSKWRIQDGQLILGTGTVTQSLHLATNTLTIRTIGPGSIATFCIDTSRMRPGDRAGACLFRDESAYVGIHREADQAKLVYVDDAKVGPFNLPVGFMNGRPVALDWTCISNGSIGAQTPMTRDRIWLRIKVDMRAAHSDGFERKERIAIFEYSYDGMTFTQLGPAYPLTKSTVGYVGYRFGIFNFATLALGGELRVSHCDIETWHPGGDL